MKQHEEITIHSDGACSGNPGPGGWGAIIEFNDKSIELSGAEKSTTNNRMELTAAIKALSAITVPSSITLITDSKYVIEGITRWLPAWKERGWKTSSKKEVKNIDLWRELDRLNQKHTITWKWVQGHNGHEKNERCDKLAVAAIKKITN